MTEIVDDVGLLMTRSIHPVSQSVSQRQSSVKLSRPYLLPPFG